ncbi:MAG: ISNCY family transposase [Clostridia bacterium]|nr:ISNCY family transposase [Clostridia bacterium]
MLRLDYPEIEAKQVSIVESLLPPEILKLPADLEKVDQILQDERFEEPFIERFNVTIGRGTVPVRPYIRLMVLKYSSEWGYETLEKKVNDSITLKKFCRIPLDKPAPDSTTLIKLNQKYGEDVIKDLNQKLMKHLTERKIIRGRKLRVDTTVVESNTHYPTDANLLKDCIDAVAKTVKKVKSVYKEAANNFRSGSRKAKQQLLKVVKVLNRRTGKSQQEVKAIVDDMVQTAKESQKAGRKVLDKLNKEDSEENRRLSKKLSDVLDTVAEIIKQTEEVQLGNTHVKDRIVSIHDKEARPIRKGKLRVKVEFGYKAQIEECEKGFVSNYEVYKGNPADDTLLMDAVDRHEETFGHVRDAVTTDRGYGSKDNERKLKEAGVKKVAIPAKGKKSKARVELEKSRWFKRLVCWRAGSEAKISLLKRKYGLDRSLSRGHSGTSTWVGWGILTHNLLNAVKYA